jgi:hypothetical protein
LHRQAAEDRLEALSCFSNLSFNHRPSAIARRAVSSLKRSGHRQIPDLVSDADIFWGYIVITNKWISLFMLGIAMAVCANAKSENQVCFTGGVGDGDWNNAANWNTGAVPGAANEAGIVSGTVKITNAVTMAYLRNGMDKAVPAEVIIDGGTLRAIGFDNSNASSYGCNGSIVVKNGGLAVFSSRFLVGYKDTQSGSVTIYDGIFRVESGYYHNKEYVGTNVLDTRTTINPGGLLDVNALILNAGVMDIAGGTLIVRQDISVDLDPWIAKGRMIAMGGAQGWKIKATVDLTTGWTTVVAEPIPDCSPAE